MKRLLLLSVFLGLLLMAFSPLPIASPDAAPRIQHWLDVLPPKDGCVELPLGRYEFYSSVVFTRSNQCLLAPGRPSNVTDTVPGGMSAEMDAPVKFVAMVPNLIMVQNTPKKPLKGLMVTGMMFDLNNQPNSVGLYAYPVSYSSFKDLGFANAVSGSFGLTMYGGYNWASHGNVIENIMCGNPNGPAYSYAICVDLAGYQNPAGDVTSLNVDKIVGIGGWMYPLRIGCGVLKSTFRDIDSAAGTAGVLQIAGCRDGAYPTSQLDFDHIRVDANQTLYLDNADQIWFRNVQREVGVQVHSGLTRYYVQKSDGVILTDFP